MSATPLKKGEYVTNPETNRPVKVGGRTYLRLLKLGKVSAPFEDDNELGDIKEGEELPYDVDEHTQAVRGRGRHKGKVVKRLRPVPASRDGNRRSPIDSISDMSDDEISRRLAELVLGRSRVPSEPKTRANSMHEELASDSEELYDTFAADDFSDSDTLEW